MNLQNGYKLIYEKAAEGKRTFYASKSNVPTAEDVEIASFIDAEYQGKIIYEYKGKFYVSTKNAPMYDENGEPTGTSIEAFDKILIKDAVNTPTHAPSHTPTQDAHVEAIATNGDSHGKLTIKENVVTLKASGKIMPATNPNGNTYHHVGFKITAPDGVDPANVIITRPDGKTRVMANILDGANFTNMYWLITEDDRVFTYYIDWNNDGVNDLTVIIDASKATLETVPAAE